MTVEEQERMVTRTKEEAVEVVRAGKTEQIYSKKNKNISDGVAVWYEGKLDDSCWIFYPIDWVEPQCY